MGKLISISKHRPDLVNHLTHLRAQGLRAWRINQSMWVCSVLHNKNVIWFLSQYEQKAKIITREVATYLLSSV